VACKMGETYLPRFAYRWVNLYIISAYILHFSFFCKTKESCEMTHNAFCCGGSLDGAGLYIEDFDSPNTKVTDITA
jgi:hypothetical protein